MKKYAAYRAVQKCKWYYFMSEKDRVEIVWKRYKGSKKKFDLEKLGKLLMIEFYLYFLVW
jgi:hypothetical protein